MVKRIHAASLFSKRWPGLCLAVLLCSGLWADLYVGIPEAMAGDDLSPFEQSFFSHDYAGDSLASRLDRLENSVFGGTQSGSELDRKIRLIKALSAAREYIPTAPGKSATDSDPANGNAPGITRYTMPGSPADAAQNANNPDPDGPDSAANSEQRNAAPRGDSDYPTVTALEREVFSRDFIREDVAHRLDRLERRAFGQASPQMGLSDRVDRLTTLYPNAVNNAGRYANPGSSSGAVNIVDPATSPAIRDLPNDSRQFVGGMDTNAKVTALEKKFFNGKSYSGELLTQRLNRLESKSYGRTYGGEGVNTRVNRLLSAYRIGSAPASTANSMLRQPDPAKWQSPEAVGYNGSFLSQRGGSGYSSASAPSASSYNPPATQNIQIGAGIGSMSSTSGTYGGYSQDMISMLPQGMQQQVTGGGMQQQSSTTAVGAPGTVITQQSTTYPGFQPYGNQPFQTYSYYGNPTVQSQTQSTTTVIQPDGSSVTSPTTIVTQPGGQIGQPLGTPLGTVMNGMPVSGYAGDPNVFQALGNLEINLYGQIDMMNPVPLRLSRLESALLHQVYPALPDAQRVANLQRAYQLQSVGSMLGNSKAANIGRAAGGMLFGVPLSSGMNPGMNSGMNPGMIPGAYPGMYGMPYTGMPATTGPQQIIIPAR